MKTGLAIELHYPVFYDSVFVNNAVSIAVHDVLIKKGLVNFTAQFNETLYHLCPIIIQCWHDESLLYFY